LSTTFFSSESVSSVGNQSNEVVGPTRLYNYSGLAGAAQLLGNLTAVSGADCGVLMPNWSTDIEDAIVAAVLAGKSIRTSVCFIIHGVKDTANQVADCDILFGFYCEGGRYILRTEILLSVDQLQVDTIACLQGEFSAIDSDGTLLTDEANTMWSLQEDASPPDSATQYHSLTNSYHANGSTSQLDGKFTCYTITNSNLVPTTSTISVRNLTIDIL